MAKVKPHYVKTCGACLEEFTTHKAKASRCPVCISENRKVTYRRCFECNVSFMITAPDDLNCGTCVEELGLEDQSQLSPEQRERFEVEEKQRLFVQKRDRLLEWLTQRDKARRTANFQPNQQNLTHLGLL